MGSEMCIRDRCHGAVLPVRQFARVGRAMENYRLDAVCAAQRSSDRSSSQRSAVLGRLGGRPTPTARPVSGGPPPQLPRKPGQPPDYAGYLSRADPPPRRRHPNVNHCGRPIRDCRSGRRSGLVVTVRSRLHRCQKSFALTRKAAAYGVGQGFQRTGPARSGGSLSWPVHETKTGSASAMDDGRVGAGCVVYRWS